MSGARSGCLPILALLASPCLAPYGVAAFATPVLAPYVYLNHPSSFAKDRTVWLVLLAAVPVLAFVLVRWASPADGRLRGRGDRHPPASRARRPGLRARRPHPIRGYLDRILLLVGSTSAVTLCLAWSGHDMYGPLAGVETMILLGAVGGTLIVVLVGIRRWDRPYVAPVTVEQVRAHNQRARKELRRIRADNERVTRMVAKLEAKLTDAHTRRDFAVLRTMHHESYGCADSVYVHYRSVEESLGLVSQLVRSVRITGWQPSGVVRRAVNRKARVAFVQLRTETGGLAGTAGELRSEWTRNRDLVQTLNVRTADLKCQIRDECGPAGLRWFEALQDRRDAARLAEGKPVS
ncbi:hypothetical protein [Actinoplanes awajinensis]|uniref:Uncharacterized protein n=1 Tax=Actinoplanes awajinensis subsp. mycoplanecinus TaxID=135947 RepID=A0A101JTF6_9ACTN|nr:hypothetical protein [Actinoplanes awajinensis]KUL32618.1 hypothetical protein ADL15_19035 [Actinoplanes awajinensis subsp. mycoplanecinus]